MNTSHAVLKFVEHARCDYHCDGCNDEFLIRKDGMYARLTMIEKRGEPPRRMRLCLRCICAILNRKNFKKEFDVENGSLTWNKLASTFKKTWSEFLQKAIENKDKVVLEEMLRKLQIKTDEEDLKMEEIKKEQRKQRVMHREKQALKVFIATYKRDVETLKALQNAVAKAQILGDAEKLANANYALVQHIQKMEDRA